MEIRPDIILFWKQGGVKPFTCTLPKKIFDSQSVDSLERGYLVNLHVYKDYKVVCARPAHECPHCAFLSKTSEFYVAKKKNKLLVSAHTKEILKGWAAPALMYARHFYHPFSIWAFRDLGCYPVAHLLHRHLIIKETYAYAKTFRQEPDCG